MESQKSNLVLNNRSELSLTGIKKVKQAEPGQVVAELFDGHVIIVGEGLEAEHLDVKEGVLMLKGKVSQIKYTANVSKSFSLKNMFR